MSDNIIHLNQELIHTELKDLVRNSVEETLNTLLDHEAEVLVNAEKYERSSHRKGYRSGHYQRNFQTTAGDVTLNIPKLKGLPFETAIIERYRRRQSSVEEALIEMYLAGVSVRRIEDITEALWGSKVSPGTISNLNKKAYERIEEWRIRPITGTYPYVYVDGIYLKRSWGGEVQNVAVLVAIGVNAEGHREIIGVAEGMKEDRESWRAFFIWLKERGLKGVRLIVGDKCSGMLETMPEVFPEAKYQRCEVTRMLKAIHAQECKTSAREKARQVCEKLRKMKLSAAAKRLESSIEETLTYMDFPPQHWTRLRTNNTLERLNREIRRRTKVIGAFPDGQSALMLVCAR